MHPFSLPPLPYDTDALEPHIGRETLELHHGKHHAGYVERLNGLVVDTRFAHESLDEVVRSSSGDLFNNAAQHWNHSFYWLCLTPVSRHADKAVEAALGEAFGSLNGFRRRFTDVATRHFGSGWTWLVRDARGQLVVRATHDADCPIAVGDQPILVCDVWEHAYYLDYKNERAKYLEAFWHVVDWTFVGHRLEESALGQVRRHADQAARAPGDLRTSPP